MPGPRKDPGTLERLAADRAALARGAAATQPAIDALEAGWAGPCGDVRPQERRETLMLVDDRGRSTGVTATRWLCHLLGLRHRCAHVLVRWSSPSLGPVLVLQLRSWEKADSPGCLDISVGGHVLGGHGALETAVAEMGEELGLSEHHLVGPLRPCGGADSYEEQPDTLLFNAEWRDLFVAEVTTRAILETCFADGEVAGVLLLPEAHATTLLSAGPIPLTGALRQSLPRGLG